jgi:hypothetical protein
MESLVRVELKKNPTAVLGKPHADGWSDGRINYYMSGA